MGTQSGRDGNFEMIEMPKVVPIDSKEIISQPLGVRIEPAEGFAYFVLDEANEAVPIEDQKSISFLNLSKKLLGKLEPFDPEVQPWPPRAKDFGDTVRLASEALAEEWIERQASSSDSVDETTLLIGPSTDFRLQVQTMLYGESRITWASPRKSPAWPLRVHLGKCRVGDRDLLVRLYELDAQTPEPVYDGGAIEALGQSLHKL